MCICLGSLHLSLALRRVRHSLYDICYSDFRYYPPGKNACHLIRTQKLFLRRIPNLFLAGWYLQIAPSILRLFLVAAWELGCGMCLAGNTWIIMERLVPASWDTMIHT